MRRIETAGDNNYANEEAPVTLPGRLVPRNHNKSDYQRHRGRNKGKIITQCDVLSKGERNAQQYNL